MNQSSNALRLNVGFLIGQSVGYSRFFYIDLPQFKLDSDLILHQLNGSAHLTRTAQGILVQVAMNATLATECSRCLVNIEQPLTIDFTELYAFNKRSVSESGLILPEDGHIDLAPLVREYMYLAIPINPICRPDCQGLCPVCGEILLDGQHHHDDDLIDPRLAQLKVLLEKNNQ